MSDSTSEKSTPSNRASLAGLAGKYLTFKLGRQQFGVQILKVREIIGRMEVTPVPGAPENVLGVLNLRGKIIPVLHLARRFGLDSQVDDSRSCIVVTEVRQDDRTIDMGLLVDAVSEVLTIPATDLEPRPSFGEEVDASFILALAKAGADVKVLVDIDKVVLNPGMSAVIPTTVDSTVAV
jgi:purine-binding chemotaxis protein CheW